MRWRRPKRAGDPRKKTKAEGMDAKALMQFYACSWQKLDDFCREHEGDTDAQLKRIVRRRARELGRMPNVFELEGGTYIQDRLGDWAALGRSLGYGPAGKLRRRERR